MLLMWYTCLQDNNKQKGQGQQCNQQPRQESVEVERPPPTIPKIPYHHTIPYQRTSAEEEKTRSDEWWWCCNAKVRRQYVSLSDKSSCTCHTFPTQTDRPRSTHIVLYSMVCYIWIEYICNLCESRSPDSCGVRPTTSY